MEPRAICALPEKDTIVAPFVYANMEEHMAATEGAVAEFTLNEMTHLA